MKKVFRFCFFILAWCILMSTSVLAAKTPILFINGELKFDVDVVLKNNTILVPLRVCGDELKSEVKWKSEKKEISISKGNTVVLFKVGSPFYFINGTQKVLSVSPTLINGVTYIPFRPLVESLNGMVLYNDVYKVINIYDSDSQAYAAHLALNSSKAIEKRFAMLEVPRISYNAPINTDSHFYIFPLETPDANYFFEYWGDWKNGHIVSLNYYSIVDGVAINTWGRRTNQITSFYDNSHPLLKLVGDDKQKNKKEFGVWPKTKDLNFVMFSQDNTSNAVFYINNIWTNFFLLDPIEIGSKVDNPFSNKNIILFDIDNETLLNKCKQ